MIKNISLATPCDDAFKFSIVSIKYPLFAPRQLRCNLDELCLFLLTLFSSMEIDTCSIYQGNSRDREDNNSYVSSAAYLLNYINLINQSFCCLLCHFQRIILLYLFSGVLEQQRWWQWWWVKYHLYFYLFFILLLKYPLMTHVCYHWRTEIYFLTIKYLSLGIAECKKRKKREVYHHIVGWLEWR